jgi:hypothetical protein
MNMSSGSCRRSSEAGLGKKAAMHWDLGSSGLLYLAVMSIVFGVLAHLLSGRASPKRLWAVVSGVYFGVGLLVSEFWFGWATEEDLQPNIDGLSRDEVLLVGLVPVAVAVVGTRWMARRHTRQAAGQHAESAAANRGQPTPHAS